MNLSKQLTRRENILLLILALLLLFCVYYFLVLRPVKDDIASLQSQCDSVSTDIDILTARAIRYNSMKEELEELKSSDSVAPVPDYDNLQQLMGFLNSVFVGSLSYDLSIQNIQQPDSSSDIVRRTMEMSFISSSYSDARSAIEKLQASPFCCQLGNVTMSPESNDETISLLSGTVRTKLTVTFFENVA